MRKVCSVDVKGTELNTNAWYEHMNVMKKEDSTWSVKKIRNKLNFFCR